MIEYLALPYSHKSERVMKERAAISDFIFRELSMEGRIVFAPITMCHRVAKEYGMPRDWRFWRKMGEAFVNISDRVLVIALPKWHRSVGLTAELDLAAKRGLEIEYLDVKHYMRKLGEWRRAQRRHLC